MEELIEGTFEQTRAVYDVEVHLQHQYSYAFKTDDNGEETGEHEDLEYDVVDRFLVDFFECDLEGVETVEWMVSLMNQFGRWGPANRFHIKLTLEGEQDALLAVPLWLHHRIEVFDTIKNRDGLFWRTEAAMEMERALKNVDSVMQGCYSFEDIGKEKDKVRKRFYDLVEDFPRVPDSIDGWPLDDYLRAIDQDCTEAAEPKNQGTVYPCTFDEMVEQAPGEITMCDGVSKLIWFEGTDDYNNLSVLKLKLVAGGSVDHVDDLLHRWNGALADYRAKFSMESAAHLEQAD